MIRKMPNIIGMGLNPIIENELVAFFNSLYDEMELLANRAGVSTDTMQQQRPSATTTSNAIGERGLPNSAVGLDKGIYAQPLLGGVADPHVRSIIPDDVVHSNLNVVAGAVPVGGYVVIVDGLGNSVEVLTK